MSQMQCCFCHLCNPPTPILSQRWVIYNCNDPACLKVPGYQPPTPPCSPELKGNLFNFPPPPYLPPAVSSISPVLPVNQVQMYPCMPPTPSPSEQFSCGTRPLLMSSIPSSKTVPYIGDAWDHHFKDLSSGWFPPGSSWNVQHIGSDPDGHRSSKDQGWRTHRDWAKVRFLCNNCKEGWTSMYGNVHFKYRFFQTQNTGEIKFFVSGQKCLKCPNEDFIQPYWYPEEAVKVLTNLFFVIARTIYGLKTPPINRKRRHGKPAKKHLKDGCQGCHLGICKINSKS